MSTHKGRVAVVTGAARGIGRAVCGALAAQGASVVGFDLAEPTETGALVASHGGQWLGLQGDVSSPADVINLFSQVEDRFGTVDILVNNAGIFPNEPFEEISFEKWRRVLSVNLDSQFLTCQSAVPLMRRNNWGRIVNIVSSSVAITSPGYVCYKASKMGVVGLTRGLAADVGPYGITVNAVSPSVTDTPGVRESGGERLVAGVIRLQAIPRGATPDDVTGVIVFLSSEQAGFLTGQTIYSDGGLGYL